MRDALVIAHRGFSRDYPENTMIAFERAIEIGADMIELDATLSDDGDFVVIHDDMLGRTAEGSGFVCHQSTKALTRMPVGEWFGEGFADQRIPTLAQVLQAFGERIQFNIELKPFFPLGNASEMKAAIRELLALLNERGLADKIIISSSNFFLLDYVRKRDADIRIGVIYRWPLTHYKPVDVCKHLSAYSLHPFHPQVSEAMLQQMHALGVRVFPYTVDEPETMRELLELDGDGVDGLFTNCPDQMLALLGRNGEKT